MTAGERASNDGSIGLTAEQAAMVDFGFAADSLTDSSDARQFRALYRPYLDEYLSEGLGPGQVTETLDLPEDLTYGMLAAIHNYRTTIGPNTPASVLEAEPPYAETSPELAWARAADSVAEALQTLLEPPMPEPSQ